MGFLGDIVSVAAPIVGGFFGGPAGAAAGSAVGSLFADDDAPAAPYAVSGSLIKHRQEELMNKLMEIMAPTLEEGVESYEGQIAPGASELQEAGFGAVRNLLFGDDTAYAQGRDVIGDLFQPFDPTAARDYFETAIRRPAEQRFERVTLPNIAERYIRGGALDSGAARRAIAGATADLESGLSGKLADIMYRGEQDRDRMRAGLLPLAADYETQPIRFAMQAGGTQRSIEAAQKQEAYNKWLASQPYSNPWLRYALPLATQATQKPIDVAVPQASPGIMSSLMPLAGELGGWLGSEKKVDPNFMGPVKPQTNLGSIVSSISGWFGG